MSNFAVYKVDSRYERDLDLMSHDYFRYKTSMILMCCNNRGYVCVAVMRYSCGMEGIHGTNRDIYV